MKRIVLAVLALVAIPAFAATDSANLTVTATVAPQCSIAAATLDLGSYDSINAATNTAAVNVTCTNTTGWTVDVPTGVELNTSPANGTPITVALVEHTSGTQSTSGTGNGTAQSVTVRGTIAAGGYYTPGSYSGDAQITVTF